MAKDVQSLAARGIEPLYFALSDPDVPKRADYDYIAVLKAPDQDSARELARNVEQAGWHDYLEQVNAHGESVPPEHVFGDMIGR